MNSIQTQINQHTNRQTILAHPVSSITAVAAVTIISGAYKTTTEVKSTLTSSNKQISLTIDKFIHLFKLIHRLVRALI